jgi:hypothetical protein
LPDNQLSSIETEHKNILKATSILISILKKDETVWVEETMGKMERNN